MPRSLEKGAKSDAPQPREGLARTAPHLACPGGGLGRLAGSQTPRELSPERCKCAVSSRRQRRAIRQCLVKSVFSSLAKSDYSAASSLPPTSVIIRPKPSTPNPKPPPPRSHLLASLAGREPSGGEPSTNARTETLLSNRSLRKRALRSTHASICLSLRAHLDERPRAAPLRRWCAPTARGRRPPSRSQ
jgi:hypothetical protein